jgi:hypothetical protein
MSPVLTRPSRLRSAAIAGLLLAFLLAACAPAASPATPTPLPATAHPDALVRAPDVPDLPFPDNPDPTQCGIPVRWGENDNRAWLTGIYAGELVQPEVLLYDSHARLRITARAPHGTPVEIVLYQANPVLDYYLVNVLDDAGDKLGEGWVPGPFLSFEPVESAPAAAS